MPDSDGISDPTDFNATQLTALGHIDALLRCQICKDFFSSAVITSCCHTFCSLCIRRSLAAEGKCPTCRTTELESKLRKNVVIQELVDAFTQARSQLLNVAHAHTTKSIQTTPDALKRKRIESDDQDLQHPRTQLPRTRSQHKHAQDRPSTGLSHAKDSSPLAPELNRLVSQEGSGESNHLVPCPICNVPMKPEAVFNHLDTCNGQATSNNSILPQKNFSAIPAIQPAADRLPQLNYFLFKENALRKKLSELGIPSWGSKNLLMKRHTEWINLWNSNCDSNHPRSRRQLLTELDSWERSQGGRAKSSDLQASNSSSDGLSRNTNDVLRKDFDGAAYAKQNKSNFDALIAMARKGAVANGSDAPNTTVARKGSVSNGSDALDPTVANKGSVSNGSDVIDTSKQIGSTNNAPSGPPSLINTHSHSLSRNSSVYNDDGFSNSPTPVSGYTNKGIDSGVGRDRRPSSPVPGFSPRLSRESSRQTPTQHSSNLSTSGRRIIRRGSVGTTAPTAPPRESSLPDRIFFRKSSIGDAEHMEIDSPEVGESNVKRRPMFELPRDPVTDADLNESNR